MNGIWSLVDIHIDAQYLMEFNFKMKALTLNGLLEFKEMLSFVFNDRRISLPKMQLPFRVHFL